MEKTIASRLKTARKQINENLSEFARTEGLSASTLTSYENGAREPSYHYLQLLSKKYGIDLNWIITGEEIQPKHIDIDLTKVKGITIKF